MIHPMIKNKLNQKLRKCVIGGVAALTLNSCATLSKADQAIIRKEVPHMDVTSLNNQLVKKQKPIDEDFLRAEDAMLNKMAYNQIFDLQIDDSNRAEQSDVALQMLREDCETMIPLTQRVSACYKKMEHATKKENAISDYDVLSIMSEICSNRFCSMRDSKIKNQNLPEDTDLNAVRAAYRHCAHKYLDGKILALKDAAPAELITQEKHELGYGILYDPLFVNTKYEDIEGKVSNTVYYVMKDIVNCVVYEYRHSLPEINPNEVEYEMEMLFSQMEEGTNAYGYQGQGAVKDLQEYEQAKQGLVGIMQKVPEMCGEPKEIEALLDEIGSSMVLLPLTRDMTKKGVKLSDYSQVVTKQTDEKLKD